MYLQLLKVKFQKLIVTQSSIAYPGSITLAPQLLQASGIREFELVHVNNRTNGNRIITYVIKGTEDGYVSVNGAAAKLFTKGDEIHVLAFAYMSQEEAELHKPLLVITNEKNQLLEVKPYTI